MRLARWACLPFSLVSALIYFFWGRELYATSAGLAAMTLWCFDPNILAHGELVTADVAAASFGLAASYTFWRWLKVPSWSRALTSGLLLGAAELTKNQWERTAASVLLVS